ncbi:zinc finger protein 418-like isoform X2 [Pleurodeles waltl]|uniref:zinc finger protein 418-like isoform X2 n=1 Tax=Pleurodeles waltl TaxID=8319 RepID=UPI0037094F72
MREDSDTVAFCDVTAYFSQEEWKLLHEWQKVLYRNVMKEIHQALISLGPLIANTVNSLRVKEKEELFSVDSDYSEARPRIHRVPSDIDASVHDLLKVSGSENEYLKTSQYTEGKEQIGCLSADFQIHTTNPRLGKDETTVSIFIDRFGVEMEENRPDQNPGCEDVSLTIKDEDDAYCMENWDRKRRECVSSDTSGGSVNKRRKPEKSGKSAGKTPSCKTPLGKGNVKVFCGSMKETHHTNNLLSLTAQEQEYSKTCPSESVFNLYPESITIARSETCKDWTTAQNPSPLLSCQPSLQQLSASRSCFERERSYGKKDNLTKPKIGHVAARPYQCAECKKSFSTAGTLVIHKRTHTGERPYCCGTCKKSFSQKGVLNRHLRIHLGERPYQCTECEKSFSQKGHLSKHLRTHNQNRFSSQI